MENAQSKLHCKYYIWMTSFLHALWLFKSYICVTYFFHELQFWALSKFRMENTPLNWQCIWMFSFLHALGLHKRNICVAYFFHELQFRNLKKILNGKSPLNLYHKYYIKWHLFLHALGLYKRNICVACFFHELQFQNLKKILNGKYSIKLVSQILHSNGFYFFRLLINKVVFTRVTFELHISFMNWNI